ncbi:EcoKI restriction-modification system protein HsdS [[Eubacterium] infirmum]|nr:EcoKI restriction-modification system protein HsdS [[Eubacterium] infirmum]
MKYKLEEIADVTMGQSPKSVYYNTEKKGFPFLQGNRTFGFKYPTFDTYTTVMTKFAKAGDVIMSVRAPVGALNITPVDMCLGRGVCSLRMKNGNQSFLFYMMKYYVSHLLKKESGTIFGSVNRNDINGLEVDIPEDIEEQNKIAGYLEMIDDKIELNSAINNNLEYQMQALFNEFLSSNEFDNLTTVEKVVLTANTGADAIQKAPIVDYDTGIRCIRVGDMTNSRSFYEWGFTKVTDEVFRRYQLHKDDIVVTRTASLGLNTIISEDLPAVYNNGVIRLTVDKSKMLPLYLYRQFQTEDFANYIARIESETSVRPNMKINYLLKYEIVLPPITKQSELIELLTPMLNKQNNLISENKQLESLRDTLLPKLMSGELDVSKINL